MISDIKVFIFYKISKYLNEEDFFKKSRYVSSILSQRDINEVKNIEKLKKDLAF